MTDEQIKHLELIEKTISRQASHSFMIKGWTLTVAVAFFGFALTQHEWALALLALVSVVLFWFLDSYYLYAERRYRCLFEDVRDPQNGVAPFSMNTDNYRGLGKWFSCVRSLTQAGLYVPLIGAAILVMLWVIPDAATARPHECGHGHAAKHP